MALLVALLLIEGCNAQLPPRHDEHDEPAGDLSYVVGAPDTGRSMQSEPETSGGLLAGLGDLLGLRVAPLAIARAPASMVVNVSTDFELVWKVENRGLFGVECAIVARKRDAPLLSPQSVSFPAGGELLVTQGVRSPEAPGTYRWAWELRCGKHGSGPTLEANFRVMKLLSAKDEADMEATVRQLLAAIARDGEAYDLWQDELNRALAAELETAGRLRRLAAELEEAQLRGGRLRAEIDSSSEEESRLRSRFADLTAALDAARAAVDLLKPAVDAGVGRAEQLEVLLAGNQNLEAELAKGKAARSLLEAKIAELASQNDSLTRQLAGAGNETAPRGLVLFALAAPFGFVLVTLVPLLKQDPVAEKTRRFVVLYSALPALLIGGSMDGTIANGVAVGGHACLALWTCFSAGRLLQRAQHLFEFSLSVAVVLSAFAAGPQPTLLLCGQVLREACTGFKLGGTVRNVLLFFAAGLQLARIGAWYLLAEERLNALLPGLCLVTILWEWWPSRRQ